MAVDRTTGMRSTAECRLPDRLPALLRRRALSGDLAGGAGFSELSAVVLELVLLGVSRPGRPSLWSKRQLIDGIR